MIMNGVKHYVKYSMKECINSEKKEAVYLRNKDIYIYEMERQERLTRFGPLPTFQTC